MPVHDWTRAEPGVFHDFHQAWTIAIRNALNSGALPEGYFAMADQVVGGPIPDVVALKHVAPQQPGGSAAAGVALQDAPPKTRFVARADEEDVYASRANRILIKHQLGELVAVIEIVSPGNKSSNHALRSFVSKACDLLDQGIHLLIVDLFPPSQRDPQGIHKAIWDEIREEPFGLPADKPLTLVSYSAGPPKTAYIEPVAVGDALPAMPIFLAADWYVPAPLEVTYQATWAVTPQVVRDLLEP